MRITLALAALLLAAAVPTAPALSPGVCATSTMTWTYLGPPSGPAPIVHSILSAATTPSTVCGGTVPMDFVSLAPPCPPLHEGPLVGAYCGPGVAPGGTFTCTWFPGAFGASSLVVGLDADGDGNVATVLAVEELTDPLGPGTWLLSNPFAYGARIIAYPTNGLATGVNYVSCG